MDNSEEGRGVQAIKRFHKEDQSEDLKKGQAVKNQLGKNITITIHFGKMLLCVCVELLCFMVVRHRQLRWRMRI